MRDDLYLDSLYKSCMQTANVNLNCIFILKDIVTYIMKQESLRRNTN